MYRISTKVITLLMCLCSVIWSCDSEQPFDENENTGGDINNGSFDDWNDPQNPHYKPEGYYPIPSGTWQQDYNNGTTGSSYLKFLSNTNKVKIGESDLYLQAERYQHTKFYQINNKRLNIPDERTDVEYKLVDQGNEKMLEMYEEKSGKLMLRYRYLRPLNKFDDLSHEGKIGVANSVGEITVKTKGKYSSSIKKTAHYTVKDRSVYLNNPLSNNNPNQKNLYYPKTLRTWRLGFTDSENNGGYNFYLTYLINISEKEFQSWKIEFYSRLADPSVFGFRDLSDSKNDEHYAVMKNKVTTKVSMKDGVLTIILNEFEATDLHSISSCIITGTFVISFDKDIVEALKNPLY